MTLSATSRRAFLTCALAVLGLAVALPRAAAQPKDPGKGKPKSPIPGYRKETIQGFTLLINEEVYKQSEDPVWKRKPLEVLDRELGTIARRLPARTVTALRRLLVWVEWEDRSDPDFGKVVAKYYAVWGNVSLWTLAKDKHPLKANNVEIIHMKDLTREHQPGVKHERCVLLHEMAHAVHYQVFGRNNPHIAAAYKQAMARSLYAEAKDDRGRIRKPAYASTNEREYFAELSCAYLDRLHYYPFTADDLKQHDPQGYKMMEQTWGKRSQIAAAIKKDAEREAGKRLAAAQRLHRAGKKSEGIEALEKLVAELPETKPAETARKLLVKWKE
jgi:hypothetical protein